MVKKASRKRCSKKSDKLGQSEKSSDHYEKTKAKIKQIFKKVKTKKAVKCSDILYTLSTSPHFIGCFSQDDLVKLDLCYPCFLMVNIDSNGEKGSHWLALRLENKRLEIFDPLGFQIFKWKSVPCSLLKFLHDHSMNKLLISPRIQSSKTSICALYCIFFIYYRNFYSFTFLCSLFSKNLDKNQKRLYSFLDGH